VKSSAFLSELLKRTLSEENKQKARVALPRVLFAYFPHEVSFLTTNSRKVTFHQVENDIFLYSLNFHQNKLSNLLRGAFWVEIIQEAFPLLNGL
jgi:hypothetical protein